MVVVSFKACCSHRYELLRAHRRRLCTVAPGLPQMACVPTDPRIVCPLGDSVVSFSALAFLGYADLYCPGNSSLNSELGPFSFLHWPACSHSTAPGLASCGDPTWLGAHSHHISSSGLTLDVASSRKPSIWSPHLWCLVCALSCYQSVINDICIHAQLKGRWGSYLTHLSSPQPGRAWHIVGTQHMWAT